MERWYQMTTDALHAELNTLDNSINYLEKSMGDFPLDSYRWDILKISLNQIQILREELILFFVVNIGYNPDNLCTTSS